MIPNELKSLDNWSAWIGERNRGKPRDPGAATLRYAVRLSRRSGPVEVRGADANGDEAVSVENRTVARTVDVDTRHSPDWVSYNEAVARAARLAAEPQIDTSRGSGACFMLTGTPYVVVDLDDCLDEQGQPSVFAADVVGRLASYTEVSIGGKGLHIVVQSRPLARKRFNLRMGIELLWFGHYVCLTGNSFHAAPKPIAERTSELVEIGKEYLGWT